MLTDKNNEVMTKILEALKKDSNKDKNLINHISERLNDIKDEDSKLEESLKILKEIRVRES
ncbi:hypothetical protein OAE31_03290 [Gammaproteobacteria bacterium]|nr:hypothetical protein [Gammaproteobacteria bacterium]MDA8997837.1 hypothetical protein [Gammaproteobacteria bacterium]MDB9984899.1 hypothetical protein [Gammaproteobacteria bacterium]|tara:strand:+ start:111 stop:293 length:183 start_codon:yes stop_codon:yes gene_type:complete